MNRAGRGGGLCGQSLALAPRHDVAVVVVGRAHGPESLRATRAGSIARRHHPTIGGAGRGAAGARREAPQITAPVAAPPRRPVGGAGGAAVVPGTRRDPGPAAPARALECRGRPTPPRRRARPPAVRGARAAPTPLAGPRGAPSTPPVRLRALRRAGSLLHAPPAGGRGGVRAGASACLQGRACLSLENLLERAVDVAVLKPAGGLGGRWGFRRGV
jgi:hypothetical protein